MLLNFKPFILLLTIGATSAFAAESSLVNLKKDKKDGTSLKLFFKTDYVNQDSELNKANQFQVRIGADYVVAVNSFTKFNLVSSVKLEAGNSNSLFGNNEFEAKNDLSLGKAELEFNITDHINVYVGALSQREIDHRLLIGTSAFLGAREEIKFKRKSFELNLSAQQTIPNNRNYSNRLDSVDEGTPKFFSETLALKLGKGNTYLKSSTTHFAFDNLSNSVAGVSRYSGNSVTAFDALNGEFLYSYIGWAQTLRAKVELTNNFLFSARAEFVENTSAPELNKASVFELAGHYLANNNEFILSVEQFNNEADASVAFYGSSRYRKNNSRGFGVSALYFNHKEQLKAELGMIDSREIKRNLLDDKDEDKIVFVMLGKSYDIF